MTSRRQQHAAIVEIVGLGARLAVCAQEQPLWHLLPAIARDPDLAFSDRAGGEVDHDWRFTFDWHRRRDRIGAQQTGDTAKWRDNALLERMVALAKVAGDIRENSLVPDKVVFRHNAYWTSHFGGLYVFVDDNTTTIISDPKTPGFRRSRPWQVNYISLADPEQVFRFLAATGRLELPRASWIETSGYLENRGEMFIRNLIHELEPERDLNAIDKIWLQTWIHTHAEIISDEGTWPFLNAFRRELANSGRVEVKRIDPLKRFLVVRALPEHPDAWLVNRLISDFVPYDFLSRYVFNKQGFYVDYQGWNEIYRKHVVEILKTTYLKDKAGLRKRLYDLVD